MKLCRGSVKRQEKARSLAPNSQLLISNTFSVLRKRVGGSFHRVLNTGNRKCKPPIPAFSCTQRRIAASVPVAAALLRREAPEREGSGVDSVGTPCLASKRQRPFPSKTEDQTASDGPAREAASSPSRNPERRGSARWGWAWLAPPRVPPHLRLPYKVRVRIGVSTWPAHCFDYRDDFIGCQVPGTVPNGVTAAGYARPSQQRAVHMSGKCDRMGDAHCSTGRSGAAG